MTCVEEEPQKCRQKGMMEGEYRIKKDYELSHTLVSEGKQDRKKGLGHPGVETGSSGGHEVFVPRVVLSEPYHPQDNTGYRGPKREVYAAIKSTPSRTTSSMSKLVVNLL